MRQQAIGLTPFLERKGEDAYIDYLLGVQTLHDPTLLPELHGLDPLKPENAPAILQKGTQLAIEGAIGVTRVVDEVLETKRQNLYHEFERARPIMRAIVSNTFEDHGQRLGELNSNFGIIRPAPFAGDEEVFRALLQYQGHLSVPEGQVRDREDLPLTAASLVAPIAVCSYLVSPIEDGTSSSGIEEGPPQS